MGLNKKLFIQADTGLVNTENFAIKTYAGSSSAQSITGVGFQPDFTWIKARNTTTSHILHDVITNPGLLITNGTSGLIDNGSNTVSFTSDGFDLAGGGSHTSVNASSINFVSWNWKAGGTAVSNTDGSVTSSVSANTAAGFSICEFTAPNTSNTNFTWGHGLSATPDLIIAKVTSTTGSWYVWHKDLSNTTTDYLRLNSTDGEETFANMWGTGQTSTVGSMRTDASGIKNQDHVAYCFHSIDGYQKIGTYTGNGSSTGPVVTTGFQPRFIMVKRNDDTGDWMIYDSVRDTTNPVTNRLFANLSSSEITVNLGIDFDATGFQPKDSHVYLNASGGTYLYLAIA